MMHKVICSLGMMLPVLGVAFNGFAADCVNISGKWKGLCTVTDENGTMPPLAQELEAIQVGCASLQFSSEQGPGDVVPFGSVFKKTETYPDGTETTTTMNLQWNSDKTGFSIQGEMNGTYFMANGKKGSYISSATGSIKLENNELVSTSNSKYESPEYKSDSVTVCRYTKM